MDEENRRRIELMDHRHHQHRSINDHHHHRQVRFRGKVRRMGIM